MNFADITERLRAAEAFCEVADEHSLTATLKELLQNQTLCQQLAKAATDVANSESDTLDRLSDAITPFLSAPAAQDTNDANA